MISLAFLSVFTLMAVIAFLGYVLQQREAEARDLRSENVRLTDKLHYQMGIGVRPHVYAPPQIGDVQPSTAFFAMRKPDLPPNRNEDE